MSRVPCQGHFYCSVALNSSTEWIIWESRCNAKSIDGSWLYRVPSRYYAYRLRKLLNDIYRLDCSFLFIVRRTLPVCYKKDYEQALRMCEAIVSYLKGSL